MTEAIALYRALGFVEIARYRPNPLPGPRYFELRLSSMERRRSTPGAVERL